MAQLVKEFAGQTLEQFIDSRGDLKKRIQGAEREGESKRLFGQINEIFRIQRLNERKAKHDRVVELSLKMTAQSDELAELRRLLGKKYEKEEKSEPNVPSGADDQEDKPRLKTAGGTEQ